MDIFEIKRKSFHIGAGFLLIFLIYFDILDVFSLSILLLISIILSVVSKFVKIPVLSWFLNQLEREKHMKTWPGKGVVFFITGALLVVALFEKDIAIASLLILTLGDGISPLVGIHYGRIRHPFSNIKFIEGTIAGAMAAFLGIMLFTTAGLISIQPLEALLASLIAMFIEGIEIKLKWDLNDDNIILPIISAIIIWLI